MTSLPPKTGDSVVQRDAQEHIVRLLAADLKVELVNNPEAITLDDHSRVEVDAASADLRFLVEAYARQGKLRGGQLKKIAQDVLKLAHVKRDPRFTNAETIIVFASREALDSVSGWLRAAADRFEVQLKAVALDNELQARILSAQGKQKMVSVDQVADDVDEVPSS